MILLHFSFLKRVAISTSLVCEDSVLWTQSIAEKFPARLEMMCASSLDVLNIIISSSLVFCPFEFYINNIFHWIHCRIDGVDKNAFVPLSSLCASNPQSHIRFSGSLFVFQTENWKTGKCVLW